MLQIINYDLDITNILVVSPQIRYIEVFDITNPPFSEQIWLVPSDFVKSRFHFVLLMTRTTTKHHPVLIGHLSHLSTLSLGVTRSRLYDHPGGQRRRGMLINTRFDILV